MATFAAMEVVIPGVTPSLSDMLIDDAGFSIELSADRDVDAAELSALASPVHSLASVVLTKEPHESRGQVSIDDGVLWVSVFVTGAGPCTAETIEFAEALFQDLWDAVHLGARSGSEQLTSAAQLLALARASRSMTWPDAIVAAGEPPPGTAGPAPRADHRRDESMIETDHAAALHAVHDGLRKEFASLPLLVKSTTEGDGDRASIVAEHIELMLQFMTAHHQGEDELLWPLVAKRAPEQAQAILDMLEEHHTLDFHARSLKSLTRGWSTDPVATARAELHSALIAFERSLLHHLGHEDAKAVPIAAGLLTTQEFADFEARVWSFLTSGQQSILLGLILDDTTPDLGDALLSATSDDSRQDFERDGRSRYQAYRRRLLGP